VATGAASALAPGAAKTKAGGARALLARAAGSGGARKKVKVFFFA